MPSALQSIIANASKDVIGDTCVNNDKGCLVFTDTEVESMEGTSWEAAERRISMG